MQMAKPRIIGYSPTNF